VDEKRYDTRDEVNEEEGAAGCGVGGVLGAGK